MYEKKSALMNSELTALGNILFDGMPSESKAPSLPMFKTQNMLVTVSRSTVETNMNAKKLMSMNVFERRSKKKAVVEKSLIQ